MSALCNFKDQIVGEVLISSTWHKEAPKGEIVTQTLPLDLVKMGIQTDISFLQATEQLDKSVGTDKGQAVLASMVGLQFVYDSQSPYNEEELASFLEAKKDGILSILNKNMKSTVFDSYEPNWTKQSTDLVSVYTLMPPQTVQNELHALGLSWSANGTMLAVAYGRMDTAGWCQHNGYVHVWNLVRADLNVNNPHYLFETDTYATCVAFHPQNSTMLAIGTYSGEIILIPSVLENIPEELSTRKASNGHREPILALQWVQNLQEPRAQYRYLLCSAAQDGQICYWNPINKMAAPSMMFGVCNKHHAPIGVGAMAYARSGGARSVNVPPNIDDNLLIGLECGDVGQGRTSLATNTFEGSDTAVPLVLDWFSGHQGPVQALSASPFFRHLFMTCSSDCTAKLYHELEREPILSLEPSSDSKHFLYDAQFSPFRPSVVALVSRSSFLHLYDLQRTQSKPLFSIEAGVDGAPVICVRFCEAAADWLATGDTRGCVQVWRLPTDMMQMTEQERAAVRAEQHAAVQDKTEGAKDPFRALFGFSS